MMKRKPGLQGVPALLAVVLLITISVNIFCSPARQLAKQTLFDSSIVFEPAAGQYASMRIPALVATPKGTLLAFCEARVPNSSDWAEMDLLMRRSTDGGTTWEPPQVISPRSGPRPNGNPTPIVDLEGNIHLVFQRDYNLAYYIKSTDDGKTWSAPVDITHVFEAFRPEYNWKVIAPGPGHAIQIRSGRLVVPVWMADSEKLEPHRSHAPSCMATIYSDDGGKTWHRGAIVANNSPEIKNPNETMAVELEDGRVMLTIRHPSPNRRKAISYSPNGISSWTKVVFDEELFEPVCMSSIIRVSGKENGDKSRILFVNPDSEHIEKHPRKNLTAKMSYDEGATWSVEKVLNPGASGYSDLAVGPDGTIYCLYETNTVAQGWNYSLKLKKFNVAWLTGGKDVFPKK